MKLHGLASALKDTVSNMAQEAASREECHLTREQFYDLVLTPEEQIAATRLADKLEPQARWQTIDVTLPGGRIVKVSACAVPEPLSFKDCRTVASAPDELVSRLVEWYDRRLATGHMAAAFEYYLTTLIDCAPTAAHVYSAFSSITSVFARCNGMRKDQIDEALRSTPRTVAMVPPGIRELRADAIKIAVLSELIDDRLNPGARIEGKYWLDLPDNRVALAKHFDVSPYRPGVELLPR